MVSVGDILFELCSVFSGLEQTHKDTDWEMIGSRVFSIQVKTKMMIDPFTRTPPFFSFYQPSLEGNTTAYETKNSFIRKNVIMLCEKCLSFPPDSHIPCTCCAVIVTNVDF